MEQSGVHLSNLVLALILLSPLLSVITSVLALRRRPPLAEEVYKDFVRRPELQALESRFEASRKESREDAQIIFNKIDTLTHSMSAAFKDVERSIGRVEGEIKRHLEDGGQ